MAPVVDVLKEMVDIVRLFRQQMDEENRKFLIKVEQLMKTAKMSGNPDESASSVHRGMTEQSDRAGSEEAQEILSSGNFMHLQPRVATVNAVLPSMTPAIPQNDEVLPIIKSLRMSSFNYQPKGIQELHPSSVNGGSDCRQNVSVPFCLPMYLQGEAVSRFDWYVLERTHINLDDFIVNVCARFREDKATQLEVVVSLGALKVFDKSPKRALKLILPKRGPKLVCSRIGGELLFAAFDPGGLEAEDGFVHPPSSSTALVPASYDIGSVEGELKGLCCNHGKGDLKRLGELQQPAPEVNDQGENWLSPAQKQTKRRGGGRGGTVAWPSKIEHHDKYTSICNGLNIALWNPTADVFLLAMFTAWRQTYQLADFQLPPDVAEALSQNTVAFGYGFIQFLDTAVAAAVCEELFTPVFPHAELALDGVAVFMNASGSHHQLRKLDLRMRAFIGATSTCGGVYVYNHQPSCDGGRLYYDGYCSVVMNGGVAVQGSQFSLKDVGVAALARRLEKKGNGSCRRCCLVWRSWRSSSLISPFGLYKRFGLSAELKHILAVLVVELGVQITEYGIVSLSGITPLSDLYLFPLMFQTSMGPSGLSPGCKSRDEEWGYNVQYTRLVEDKGGGIQFVHGADPYLDRLSQMIPEIAFGNHTRVVLEVGYGVASCGAFLMSRDVHENQGQLALERGVLAKVSASVVFDPGGTIHHTNDELSMRAVESVAAPTWRLGKKGTRSCRRCYLMLKCWRRSSSSAHVQVAAPFSPSAAKRGRGVFSLWGEET